MCDVCNVVCVLFVVCWLLFVVCCVVVGGCRVLVVERCLLCGVGRGLFRVLYALIGG